MRHLVVVAAVAVPLILMGPEGAAPKSANACGVKVSIKGAKIARARRPTGSSGRAPIAVGPVDVAARGTVNAGGDASGRGGPAATGGGETVAARTPKRPKRATPPPTREETPKEEPTTDVGRKVEEPSPKEETPKEEPAPTPGKAGGKFPSHYFFGNGSSVVSAANKTKLKQTARWLKNNPDKSIVIEGHASTNGNLDANRQLSEVRANMVKDVLVSLGADESRISVEAFGSDRPEFKPGSSAKNRRVVIVVK